MKILHVVEASLAGVGGHVIDLSEGLLDLGHEVHLAYSPRRQDRFFQRRLQGIDGLAASTVLLRRRLHPSDVTGLQAIRRIVRQRGPFDVIHGHSSKGGALARLAALSTDMPAVYTPHAIRTLDPTVSPLTRFALVSAERLLARVEGMVIAVSRAEADHLLRIGIPPHRVRVVPNCVRPVDLPTRSQARRQLGLPDDAKVVGFVGRLTAQKAPEVLVSAFYRVTRFMPGVFLAVIGEGPLRTPLERACEQLGIQDRVLWLGERAGQLSMPAFDVLALPSRYEGLPLVLLEALQAGLPIVATEEASAGMVVEPGVNGLVVPMDDPDAVADAVLYLFVNEGERESFGQASRFLAARFSLDRMVKDTERVYYEVVNGHSPEPASSTTKEIAWRGTS